MNPASESVDESSPLIGVIGNPNTGKTTLFNALTGPSQRVGNYSGVTVERKQGKLRIPDGSSLELLDLPGSYSLDGQSPDERIVTELLQRRADGDQPLAGILIVVDAVHLKRNFNLVAQVLATGLPAALVVNHGRPCHVKTPCRWSESLAIRKPARPLFQRPHRAPSTRR